MGRGGILKNSRRYLLLDRGSITLEERYGSDDDIVRRSWWGGARRREALSYLIQHGISAPFGFCGLILEIVAPQFVRDSLFRTRLAWRQEGPGLVELTDGEAGV